MSRKKLILDALLKLQNKEIQAQQVYKARAYKKVLTQIEKLPQVNSLDDLKNVQGIGKAIRSKLVELLETGELKTTENTQSYQLQKDTQELMQVFGIGPVTAKDLVEQGIHSLEDLKNATKNNPNLLTLQQSIGLKYIHDLSLKISRAEMDRHHVFLDFQIHRISPEFIFEIVGSYRRGAKECGDIDVLVTLPSEIPVSERSILFRRLCESLRVIGYIQDFLVFGSKKCMSICKIDPASPARRIDLVFTSREEYPFALIHGTGSDQFQIDIRAHAMKLGYSLSEYGMKKIQSKARDVPKMTNEKDIFEFLQFPYLEPFQR